MAAQGRVAGILMEIAHQLRAQVTIPWTIVTLLKLKKDVAMESEMLSSELEPLPASEISLHVAGKEMNRDEWTRFAAEIMRRKE
jgi:hypothetical protein